MAWTPPRTKRHFKYIYYSLKDFYFYDVYGRLPEKKQGRWGVEVTGDDSWTHDDLEYDMENRWDSIESLTEFLNKYVAICNLTEPGIKLDYDYGLIIDGFVPMSPEDLKEEMLAEQKTKALAAKRKQQAAARKAKKEAEDKKKAAKQITDLLKKYPHLRDEVVYEIGT